eukprot:TRINITY_DN5297_c0_g1_i1.p1 TRINITY_DN5297_c0_g1~~TRINITY_DN5297_c0_g1_i1.p1  ORF type:complete len:513 (+),score=98.64 TRINITY_DN5297_c0_g1_i1:658-2196(+)
MDKGKDLKLSELNKDEEEGEWTKLDISSVKLVVLSPNIAIYSNLTELYLQNNNLTSLPSELFRSLRQLRVLDLSTNQITWLQPEISQLLQLRELNLNWNSIRELPNEMGKLFRLQKLSLEGNPINKPGQDVIKAGTQQCISYLREKMPAGEPPPVREWAVSKKPSHLIHNDKIRVLCYNILAESYAAGGRINYCASWALSWDYRKHRILKEILLNEPGIVCLQEVECLQFQAFFLPEMKSRGYTGKYHPKSRWRTMDETAKKTVDGCAIFWKCELFNQVSIGDEELIEYQAIALRKHDSIGSSGINRLMNKDNIAIAVLLELKGNLKVTDNEYLLVVNTHIHWDPNFSDVKLMQVQMLVERIEEIASKYGRPRDKQPPELPMIVCGDFNSSPSSAVYQLLGTKKVKADHSDFCKQDYGGYTQKGLEHSLNLSSAYGTVTGEPAFTNYTDDFAGVLDYIWFTDETLSAERVLIPHGEDIVLNLNGALPNPYMCSDHIPLVCDIGINKTSNRKV